MSGMPVSVIPGLQSLDTRQPRRLPGSYSADELFGLNFEKA